MKSRPRYWLSAVVCVGIIVGVTAACVSLFLLAPRAGRAAAGGRPRVVATTSIIGDWAGVVGGGDVDLTTLVGPDGDPHEYKPVPADSVTLARADLILENGLGLENWLDKLAASAGTAATRVVLTKGVEARRVPASEGGRPDGDDLDPHAWQSVRDAAVMVANLRDALVKADPAHAAGYAARAGAYLKQLDDLDAAATAGIRSIPSARRKLVTSHDAFGYFGDRYGIDVSRTALESVTTEASDPSARQIADVVARVRASGVPVIFVENVQNRKLIDRIAAEAGVRVGPPLYSDSLGKPGTDGETYLKMMAYNVRTLAEALAP